MSDSWVPGVEAESDFSLANIPFGVISTPDDPAPRIAVAIGASVLDLREIAAHPDFFEVIPALKEHRDVFSGPSLNSFAALGRPVHRGVRAALQDLLSETTSHPGFLKDNAELREKALLSQKSVTTHLPMDVGDYTDFYAGYHHAYNAGAMFRGPQGALQPNYTHLPVAYHGRASSVVVSRTAISRPWGQIVDPAADPKVPATAPSRMLDFELELGCLVSTPNERGAPIPIDRADDHIFGYVLLNDWSARDIQLWEYVPLGPFNSKNFATTISPWVVLADALEPFRAQGLENKTPLQDYLKDEREAGVFDIHLEVDLTSKPSTETEGRDTMLTSRSPGRRYDDHLPDERQEPVVVVPADDRAPLAWRLSLAHRRPAGVGHHQRTERGRARLSAGDIRRRQEGRLAGWHELAHLSEGRRRRELPRPLRRGRAARRLRTLRRPHLLGGQKGMMSRVAAPRLGGGGREQPVWVFAIT